MSEQVGHGGYVYSQDLLGRASTIVLLGALVAATVATDISVVASDDGQAALAIPFVPLYLCAGIGVYVGVSAIARVVRRQLRRG